MSGERPIVLEMHNVRFSYGSVEALKGVDFNLFAGEIHVLTGDHRSGKSTLAGIISGQLKAQVGTISLNGKERYGVTPMDSVDREIGMVYQFPKIAPSLNVLENLFMGRMPHFLITARDMKQMYARCRELFGMFKIDIDPNMLGSKLTEGQKEMIELARVISLGTSIIILDEISSRLTPPEMENLYRTLTTFKETGKSVLYITSNMDEAFRIADRVTVLRNGVRQGTENIRSVDRSRLINLAYNFALNRDSAPDEKPQLLFINRYDESIIRDLPTGIILLDADNAITVKNPAAEKIFGHSGQANEKRRNPVDFVEFLSGHEIEKRSEIIEAVTNRRTFSWEKLTLDGNKIIKLKVFPLRDEAKTFISTTIFVEDVSIDYVTKEYLLRAEKVASTAELAAGVAHEINNPLGIIQNYVELLRLKPHDADEADSINHIQDELNRIVEIIGSLLSFSRVKQSPARMINLNMLLDEILILVSHKLNEKHIELHKDYRDSDVVIEGYDNKLKQLFLNLLANSIDAVLDHGTITIRIEWNRSARNAQVSIVDNGHGIPPEIRSDIFTPFFSTKMTKTNTGLGLSICQHIVELHNGLITFSSDPGKETCFTVKLPR
jgi:two-component system, NtrC family, sensor histidine kinase AtoS